MFKVIFFAALTLSAFSTYAQESIRCSCQQDFEDYMGNVTDVTVHVACPNYDDKNDLDCSSIITDDAFSATCANTVTEEHNTTSVKPEQTTKPTSSYTYCRLN
jgi:hypothetical protein